MRLHAPVVCALLGSLLFGTAGAQNAPGAPPFQARVDRAVEAGVEWLRTIQRPDGEFRLRAGGRDAQWAGGRWQKGANALAVYALAVCDLPADDSALVRGFRRLREDWRGRPRNLGPGAGLGGSAEGITTYFVSLCLMALDARANRGVAHLGKGPPGRRGRKPKLSKEDAAWVLELTEWLRRAQDPGRSDAGLPALPPDIPGVPVSTPGPDAEGGFGYTSPAWPGGYHDHSNSQFAALGLKAAARLGAEVPELVWIRALRHFLKVQEEKGPLVARVPAAGASKPLTGRSRPETVTTSDRDEARGWKYLCAELSELPGAAGFPAVGPLAATPAMTAGGVSTLVVCRSELAGRRVFRGDLEKRTEKGIRDGLAWLGKSLGGPIRGGALLDDFYFLYGLERACVLAGVTRITGRDWYRVGAERILLRQRPDGSIKSRSDNNGNGLPLIDTCFGLLFLKKAVFRVPALVATEPPLTADDFEVLLARYVAADPEGREALIRQFVARGKDVVPELIRRLTAPDVAVRSAAAEILRRTTGQIFGFDPTGPPIKREVAVVRWESWWRRARDSLIADEAAGRFQER